MNDEERPLSLVLCPLFWAIGQEVGSLRDTGPRATMSGAKATNITWHAGAVSRREREQLLNQKGVTVWLTGLSASGKSTIASILEQQLLHARKHAYRLDGDNIRHGLN